MTAVENVLLVFVLLLVQALPLAVLVTPPVVMAVRRRWSIGGVVLWAAGIALVVAWGAASIAEMDRVDATGEGGSIVSEIGWLLAAAAAATASVVLAVRPRGARA